MDEMKFNQEELDYWTQMNGECHACSAPIVGIFYRCCSNPQCIKFNEHNLTQRCKLCHERYYMCVC